MNMYQEEILDHNFHPRNHGLIEKPSFTATEHNTLCGDQITITARIENNNIIDIKFNGHGCAISQASASLLTDSIKEKKITEALLFSPENMYAILNIPISPSRINCALLALKTLHKGLKNYDHC